MRMQTKLSKFRKLFPLLEIYTKLVTTAVRLRFLFTGWNLPFPALSHQYNRKDMAKLKYKLLKSHLMVNALSTTVGMVTNILP